MEEMQWQLVQRNGEISHLKSQLKQSNSETTNKNNDLFGLKSQLKDAQQANEDKDTEILRLKTELEMTSKDNASLRKEVEDIRKQLAHAHLVQQSAEEALRRNQSSPIVRNQASPAGSVGSGRNSVGGPVSPKSPSSTNPLSINPITANPLSSNPLSSEQRREIEELKVELNKLKTEMEKTCSQFEQERTQWLDEKNKVIRYQKHLQLNYVQMYRKNKMLESEVEQLMVELENRDLKLSTENGPIEGESSC